MRPHYRYAIIVAALVVVAGLLIFAGIRAGESVNAGQAATLQRLQAQSAGECYRVNYARWLNNRSNFARWRTDTVLVHDFARTERQLQRRLRHTRKSRRRARLRQQLGETGSLLRLFRSDASALHYSPLTDCRAALQRPSTYVPPLAVSFASRTFRRDRHLLRKPPLTPAQGHY